MEFSIIIPALDEAAGILPTLESLVPFRARGAEVIVADGGSEDDTIAIAEARCDRVVSAPRGRARQMNAGAAAARGDVLLFLHADTRLPPGALEVVQRAMNASNSSWGRFDVSLSGEALALRVVEWAMNVRSRLSGIATGDQAMFIRRESFAAVGGFPDMVLMEDVEMSARLRALGEPICLRDRVITSSRRWEENGILATIILMWSLRFRYFLGAQPESLARRYSRSRR